MKRILTALILIPLVLLLVFLGPKWQWLFTLLVTLVAALAGWEYMDLSELGGAKPPRVAVLLAILALFAGKFISDCSVIAGTDWLTTLIRTGAGQVNFELLRHTEPGFRHAGPGVDCLLHLPSARGAGDGGCGHLHLLPVLRGIYADHRAGPARERTMALRWWPFCCAWSGPEISPRSMWAAPGGGTRWRPRSAPTKPGRARWARWPAACWQPAPCWAWLPCWSSGTCPGSPTATKRFGTGCCWPWW